MRNAFADLFDELVDCHETDAPEETAISVVRGWLAAQGPAFEFEEEEWVLQRTYRAAAQAGFRELGPVRDLRETMQQSRTRWLELRSQIGRPTNNPLWGSLGNPL